VSCTDCRFKVGQIGAILVIDLVQVDENGTESAFDVSSATTLQVVVGKPAAAASSPQTFTAAFAEAADGGNGTGTDGKIKFATTLASDFDVAGDYIAEPYIIDPVTGFNGRTQRISFAVEATI
jgi:hypothetical protein